MSTKNYLPFQDTPVDYAKSIAETLSLLRQCGFTEFAQIEANGREMVIAVHNGIEFVFEAKAARIKDVLYERPGNRLSSDECHRRAKNIAWRILWNQVKVATDSIKYDVAEISQVFGGYLTFKAADGSRQSVAGYVTTLANDGKLDRSGVIAGLLPQGVRQDV